jgi:chaperonin GroEL
VRRILRGEEARTALLEGAELIASIVGSTMGPEGRNVVWDPALNFPTYPSSTRDGVTVASQILLENNPAASAVKMIQEAAKRTLKEAGDGTSATCVLAYALLKNGFEALKHNPLVSVRRQMMSDVQKVCDYIDSIKRPVGDMLDTVAMISANNDEHLGRLVAEATRQAGEFGVITVEESMGDKSSIERIEGMSLDQGYISAVFVNDERRQAVEFTNAVILLIDRPLTSMQGLAPLMNAVASQSRPLLVLAEDVRGEALATFAQNKLAGRFQVCCVKLPTNLGHRKDLLLDLAALTGGTACLQELGMDLSSLNTGHLGRAARVSVTSSVTRISGGAGSTDAVAKRIETIQGLLKQSPTDLEREKLNERLAKLTGGLTVIRLAARSGLEMGDLRARCEDSCLATRCALEGGVVTGAGMALFAAQDILEDGPVRVSLTAPALQIASNAGCAVGFDALSGRPIEPDGMTVIDPALVVKAALRNAASVAIVMLASDCVIQISEDK